MVNDDILIKTERGRGHKRDWPQWVRAMRARMRELKVGFPGLGNDHMDLVEFRDIEEGEEFIWDLYLESLERSGDEAPLLLKKLPLGKALIDGIGEGLDSKRDPDRLMRWMDVIDLPEIPDNFLVLRLNIKPSVWSGGPGYFYMYKQFRDNRY